MNYDIIGDIHGHADALKILLKNLGYRYQRKAWRNPGRQAIFIGDFIDRGPKQIESVDIVRRMVDSCSARAIMGNHEFNAIAWYIPDPRNPGEYLRAHVSSKYGNHNYIQHKAFLEEVGGKAIHAEYIDWFLTLPLWLELPGIKVVHACWNKPFMDYLSSHLTRNGQLTRDLMIEATREPVDEEEKDTPDPSIFKAVEAILKGFELPLPYPYSFMDNDGKERRRVRIRWWDPEARSFNRAAMLVNEEVRANLPEDPVPAHVHCDAQGTMPTFFGHYWLTGIPQLLADRVACVDYSIAKGGRLVAYRWDGEPTLDNSKFCWVGDGEGTMHYFKGNN